MDRRNGGRRTPDGLLLGILRPGITVGAFLCVLVACKAELATDPARAPIDPASSGTRFVVGLYRTCSDRTTPADRVLMPSFRQDLEATCVDASDTITGIEPEFVRVSSPDGYAGQLFVRCEHPTPLRWQETLSARSRTALVAEGQVLAKFHTTGNAEWDRCGIFTAEDTEAAIAMCRQMMRAWKKDPSACEQPCRSAQPLTTTCIER